jgi:hypothetical protein
MFRDCVPGGVILYKLKRTKLGTKLSGRVSLQKHPAHPHYRYDLSIFRSCGVSGSGCRTRRPHSSLVRSDAGRGPPPQSGHRRQSISSLRSLQFAAWSSAAPLAGGPGRLASSLLRLRRRQPSVSGADDLCRSTQLIPPSRRPPSPPSTPRTTTSPPPPRHSAAATPSSTAKPSAGSTARPTTRTSIPVPGDGGGGGGGDGCFEVELSGDDRGRGVVDAAAVLGDVLGERVSEEMVDGTLFEKVHDGPHEAGELFAERGCRAAASL